MDLTYRLSLCNRVILRRCRQLCRWHWGDRSSDVGKQRDAGWIQELSHNKHVLSALTVVTALTRLYTLSSNLHTADCACQDEEDEFKVHFFHGHIVYKRGAKVCYQWLKSNPTFVLENHFTRQLWIEVIVFTSLHNIAPSSKQSKAKANCLFIFESHQQTRLYNCNLHGNLRNTKQYMVIWDRPGREGWALRACGYHKVCKEKGLLTYKMPLSIIKMTVYQ